jgi:hypothetical protein
VRYGMFPKSKRYKNEAYREYIKQQPCCITGMIMVNEATGKTESDPHHTVSKGAGGSDLSCVPLLHELHVECHNIGQETFQEKYDINFKEIRLKLLEQWIEEGRL